MGRSNPPHKEGALPLKAAWKQGISSRNRLIRYGDPTMERGCADVRNSRISCPENDATIVARSVGKHGFRLPQLSGLQNCLPEEVGRRFAAPSKDTGSEGGCTPVTPNMSNHIQDSRSGEWELGSKFRSYRLCECNNRGTKQWHGDNRDTSWGDTTLALCEECQYAAGGKKY